VLESLVDLTYRGIALGRAVKLTHVRPAGGFLELASAMPVGSELTVSADGVTFGATVTWVHELVTGSDRVPGMMIAPRLASDAASAWWQARVSLADDQVAKPALPRSRPVTVRPRTQTRPAPPPEGALTGNTPAIIADLSARIAAAAPRVPGARNPTPPAVAAVPPPITDPPSAPRELVMEADEPEAPAMRRTGEHVVVDDGAPTTTMAAVDPATLDIDPGSSGAMVAVADTSPANLAEPAGKPAPDEPAGGGKRKKRRSR